MEIFGKSRKEEIKVIELLGKYKKYRIILKSNEQHDKFTNIYITNIDHNFIYFVFCTATIVVNEILDDDNVIGWIEEYKSCYEG